MSNITENEREVLQAILDSEFHDGADPVNNWVWSFSANPWAGTADSRKFAGVLVSLMQKKMAAQDGEGRDACVCIRQLGMDALRS